MAVIFVPKETSSVSINRAASSYTANMNNDLINYASRTTVYDHYEGRYTLTVINNSDYIVTAYTYSAGSVEVPPHTTKSLINDGVEEGDAYTYGFSAYFKTNGYTVLAV